MPPRSAILPFSVTVLPQDIRQLIVHRLVLAYDKISFAVFNDAYRAAAFDTFGTARLPMLFADRVVIDITHHIHHFAGNSFRGRCGEVLLSMFVFLRERQRGNCEGCDKRRNNCNFQNARLTWT